MYAYGVFGVEGKGDAKRFDASADLNYHHDRKEMIKALVLHCDLRFGETVLDVDEADRVNHAAKWSNHKATIRANVNRPYQQIAAPDGRIYWWMRVV